MKKIFFSALLVAAVMAITSCGANRKLGCPATAKNETSKKNPNS